jgi:hypothetical protein
MAAASLSNVSATAQRSVLPTPPDWIDNETGHEPAMFIGQSLSGSDLFWSIEFWNQSIHYVWSVDGTAPTPGPTTTPNYADTTGEIDPQPPVDWVIAGQGVTPVGKLQGQPVDGLSLYRVPHPIRIAYAEGNISTDANWMQTSAWYYRFTSAGRQPGYATVTLSRAAACGNAPPSHITIRLSSLKITPEPNAQPVPDKLLAVRHVTLHSNPCETKTFKFPARAPYRFDLSAVGTFQVPGDSRNLSAQVTFGFEPKK